MNAPKFLGASPAIGTPSSMTDNQIGGRIAAKEDYFVHTSEAGWPENNRIYQWNGTQWDMKSPDDINNMNMYWNALPQMTSTAPEQVISTAFINSLIANNAFIKNLYMQQGVVQEGGTLHSANYRPGESGWILTEETFEAENGKFIGRVEAESGSFNGSIQAGPLFASHDSLTPGIVRTFNAGTTFREIVLAFGQGSFYSANGTYAGKTGGLTLVLRTTIQISPNYQTWTVIIRFDDGTVYSYTDQNNTATIPNQLIFRGGVGKTLRMEGLPSFGDGLPAGTIYTYSMDGGATKFLMVK